MSTRRSIILTVAVLALMSATIAAALLGTQMTVADEGTKLTIGEYVGHISMLSPEDFLNKTLALERGIKGVVTLERVNGEAITSVSAGERATATFKATYINYGSSLKVATLIYDRQSSDVKQVYPVTDAQGNFVKDETGKTVTKTLSLKSLVSYEMTDGKIAIPEGESVLVTMNIDVSSGFTDKVSIPLVPICLRLDDATRDAGIVQTRVYNPELTRGVINVN